MPLTPPAQMNLAIDLRDQAQRKREGIRDL
jgi:hypothetical protein